MRGKKLIAGASESSLFSLYLPVDIVDKSRIYYEFVAAYRLCIAFIVDIYGNGCETSIYLKVTLAVHRTSTSNKEDRVYHGNLSGNVSTLTG